MTRSRVNRPKRSTQKGAAVKTLAVLVEDSGEPLDMPCSNYFLHRTTFELQKCHVVYNLSNHYHTIPSKPYHVCSSSLEKPNQPLHQSMHACK
ncbi:hypothetical protein B0H65DRAFT_477776 [Neurospora tetraspora]|uniref:Uncharacterized protein n=1 Tax=Neurospora tetraspora TaxID=94610 RepID=A0AAE0J730_9PEZI|nr:hypothetical protein B0H65DRAFT_477776 [Neurospora tetraspora]